MKMNNYKRLGLYEHNIKSYEKVKEQFQQDNIVAIVHATGTGKSFNALQLALDNKDKQITYIVPSSSIIEHLKEIINQNKNLTLEEDFPNLKFRTYQSLINLSKQELEELDIDLLILDEFHHIGAPVWGARIDSIVQSHKNMQIFGMTAYTVRDRGTIYERDMTNSETDELFSNKVVSTYDLCDAMIDGVLPKPIYKSAYVNLIDLESSLEQKVLTMNASTKEYNEYIKILTDVKKKLHQAKSISDIIKINLKRDGKYIYFCPPASENGVNDIESIIEQAKQWLYEMGLTDDDYYIYKSIADMEDHGKSNRSAFYNDEDLDGNKIDKKLRIMFAINQYNEGIHAPNIDGVIMGRSTMSDIIYFEQLGRALSVRGITKEKFEEYEQKSIDELKQLCKSRDIVVKLDASKEEIIEKLLSPVIIDLANNYEYIKELENNLKNRLKEEQTRKSSTHRICKISDASFDIEIDNQDLFEMLRYVRDRLSNTWDDYYNLAKNYYEHYKNLRITQRFKTLNGIEYDENGVSLGSWLNTQKRQYKRNELPNNRVEKLKKIGIDLDESIKDIEWEEKYELLKIYYEYYHNLLIPQNFRTLNGIEYDENGVTLGSWFNTQKMSYRNGTLRLDRKEKLERIVNSFEKIRDWQQSYELAKNYYEYYGNSNIPQHFKTINGYDYDESGFSLGSWADTQRANFKTNKLLPERRELLEKIEFRLQIIDYWQQGYEMAKKYYEYHGNLEMLWSFKTTDGISYDDDGLNLGRWVYKQKKAFKKGTLNDDKKELLEKIGMKFEKKTKERQHCEWEKYYNLAKNYYEHHKNINIPQKFKTINGIEYNENGINLGSWLVSQKQSYKKGSLSLEHQTKLEQLGVDLEVSLFDKKWIDTYELLCQYIKCYGNIDIPKEFKTKNGIDYNEKGINLKNWLQIQITNYKKGKLPLSRQHLLEQQGIVFEEKDKREIQWEEKYKLAKNYFEHYKHSNIPKNFVTLNGIDYDEDGINLGEWVYIQKIGFKENKLSLERQEKLNQINLELDKNVNEIAWNEKYELLKKYYGFYGDINVPTKFKTKNGIDYDKDGIHLGSWLIHQKEDYKNNILTLEQREKLEIFQADLEQSNLDRKWQATYELLCQYKQHYQNFNIPKTFKTKNGIDYDEEGTALRYWLNDQKRKYKKGTLSKTRQEKLEQLGVELSDDVIKSTIIDENNKEKYQKKILKEIELLLNKYDSNSLPQKDDINQSFIEQLKRKIK